MSLRVAGIIFIHTLLSQIIYSLFTLHRPGNLEKTVSQRT